MTTKTKAVALGALAVVAKVAGLAPDVSAAQVAQQGDDTLLGMCSSYGSVCTTGFECCSEDCVTFTDGKMRCNS